MNAGDPGVRDAAARTAGAEGLRWLEPAWDVDARVRVISTLRSGGVSRGPHAALNLARHVGDEGDAVTENRRRLRAAARLPAEPAWLEQVHGTRVVDAATVRGAPTQADASVAHESNAVCTVMTADCLPVVIADRGGTRVAVAHAGWRGLVGGVIEATLGALQLEPARLVAWLGPAISQPAFEVGAEVREAFIARNAGFAPAFMPNDRGRYQADLYELTRKTLGAQGVVDVRGGGWCTVAQRGLFHSFRRDHRAGRMATLAWLAD